jgi:hypothetical protein
MSEKPPVGPLGPTGQTWPRSTLLVKSRRSVSNAIGVNFTRGMSSVSLAFKRRIRDRCSTLFCINQQSQDLLYLSEEFSRLT